MANPTSDLNAAHAELEAAIESCTNESPGAVQVHKTWREKLAASAHQFVVHENLGNDVAITRGPNPETMFESVPLVVRIGMHCLYVGKEQEKLLGNKRIDDMLRAQSISTGRKYDVTGPEALKHIKEFVETYKLDLSELAEPKLERYKTFNEFFARQLKEGARPIDAPEDPNVITSAADSRLTVFESVDLAKQFWIKGEQFTIGHLFDDEEMAAPFADCSVAIFRLAPADYHRSHSPVDATVGPTKHIDGTYFTVNPCAIRENLDVFTRNRRDVTMLKLTNRPEQAAFVAVGAMLVGSIVQSRQEGDHVKRGDLMSYYMYGGSTSILLLPKGTCKFDDDLIANSKKGLETAVKVGNHIGTFV